MKNKILKSCMALMLAISTLSVVDAYSYQSNPDVSGTRQSCDETIKNIRYMETVEGVMGLNAEFDFLTETTSSNNIDIHLLKSTEYAAIAMLAKSTYGVEGKNISNGSTTNNMTGVFGVNGNDEVVAGIREGTWDILKNRYVDRYFKSSSTVFDETNYNIGDGTYECAGWGSQQEYFRIGYYMVRTSLFGVTSCASNHNAYQYCRAAVWCGQGL